METTEKVVESYCRYVRQWFTIPNIKCRGQYEIDLLAVDTTNPKALSRYPPPQGVTAEQFCEAYGNAQVICKHDGKTGGVRE